MLKQRLSFKADEAVNGEIGVEMVKDMLTKECCDKMYKLILMDLQMPVMNGFIATTKIQALFKQFKITTCQVVAVTSNTTERDKREATAAGMIDFYQKPLRADKLADMLAKYYSK